MLKFQTYTDAKGEYRWRLLAGNNEIIAASGEGYKSIDDCKHAIGLIQAGAATASVVEAKPSKPKTAKTKAAAATTNGEVTETAAKAKPKTKKAAAPKAATAPKAKAKKA